MCLHLNYELIIIYSVCLDTDVRSFSAYIQFIRPTKICIGGDGKSGRILFKIQVLETKYNAR